MHETLSRVLHLMQLLNGYQPRDMLACPTVLAHSQDCQPMQQGPMWVVQLLDRVADDSWRQVAPALLPMTACSLAAGDGSLSSHGGLAETVESLVGKAANSRVMGDDGRAWEQAQLTAVLIPLNNLCVNTRYVLLSKLVSHISVRE